MVNQKKESVEKIIVARASFGDFVQYALYSPLSPEIVQHVWRESDTSHHQEFVYENILFTSGCVILQDGALPAYSNHSSILYFATPDCARESTPSGEIRDYAGNTIWKMYTIHQ